MELSGLLLQCFMWSILTRNVIAVDVMRAIFYPKTFEESLCFYVVAFFVGGWITILTSALTYWMYFRVPVPRYTYKLVMGGDAHQAHREAAAHDADKTVTESKEPALRRLKSDTTMVGDDMKTHVQTMLTEMETQREEASTH